jgi:hypothetical protein
MEAYWNYQGGKYWSKFANDNNLSLIINNVFFNFDNTPERGANEFLHNRIDKILNTITENTSRDLPFYIVLAGEPYFPYQGQIIWHGQYDKFMPYKELGQNWIIEAEVELLNQIYQKKINPERVGIIGINLPGIETPNATTIYTTNYVINLKQQVFERLTPEVKEYLGITSWQEIPFDIGMEFHLGNQLGDRNITLPVPFDINVVINNVNTIKNQTGSEVHITELDGVGNQRELANAMVSLIKSNVFSTITFFEPLKPINGPQDPWQNIIFDNQQHPTQWYYQIIGLLYQEG